MTKSRLQKILDPIVGIGTNIFNFHISDTGAFDHSNTQAITITRGGSGRQAGYVPATLEATVLGRLDGFPTGSPAGVQLRDVHVDRLADYCGVTAESIRYRYRGRAAMVSIDDRGKDASTTFTAVSWMAQLNNSPRHVTPQAGELLPTLLERMTFMDDPVRGTELIARLNGNGVQHHAAGEPMLFKDAIGDLAEDIGIVLHEQRNGTTVAWGHSHREWWAANRMSQQWPLMRSNAIAPATYSQLGERPPNPIDYHTNTPQYPVTRSIDPPNNTGETVMREEIDWTRWRVSGGDDQLHREAWAQAYSAFPTVYSIPEITIDMLMLLRKNTEYSRKIAGQILTLEAGEPIYLSGDWPVRLRGVHYAEGIKETIGPDEWRFDLSLIPHTLAAGIPTPTVPAIAWDSFTTAWDQESRRWDL